MKEKEYAARAKNHRKRHKKKKKQRYTGVIRLASVMIALLVVAVVVIVVSPKRSHTVIINHPAPERDVEVAAPAAENKDVQVMDIQTTQAQDGEITAEIEVEPTAAPTETPAAEPTAAPAAEVTAEPQAQASTQGFEYLPVYKRANILEAKIAITVDDCFQVNNLQTIAATAYENNAKLTIFPIGENFAKSGMVDTLRTCVFKLGYEIENHTWNHERVFRLPEEQMAEQIWKQRQGLNLLLGANYEQHFFRLMGGDGSSDQRTHNYLKQLGYKGIAEWSVSGSDATMEEIKMELAPGQIYLFHTTDGDTAKLQEFIPYAVRQGYQLVTLNELLGFPENEISEYVEETMPEPQPYVDEYRTHKVGDYAWNVVLMQDKLRNLGLLNLDGPSTGYYGQQTADAVAAYQKQVGLEPNGIADATTQKKLLNIAA